MSTIKSKVKSQYVCQECGSVSFRWSGKCNACDTWNSIVEELIRPERAFGQSLGEPQTPKILSDIHLDETSRFSSGFEEINRLLGGGVVQGSFVLIGGEPGIGKSTVLLQVSNAIACQGKTVLYVSGEESLHQIKSRAERLGAKSDRIFLLSEVSLELIVNTIESMKPDVVIIDSVQIIYRADITSSPGSVSQVRECSNTLMQLAKRMNIPIFLVGHVTKEGSIAGPKVLEHIVDTVLYFEGDRHHSYRILRAVKNRFGSTNEVAIFEMHDIGLVQVTNPSELFLSDDSQMIPGSVVVPCMEGTRPLLVEIQALVSDSHQFGHPRRVSTFIDSNRVALLIAIFEKRLGVSLASEDVFINLVGGIKINEPSADLGVIVAMMSSLRNKLITPGIVIMGEVGLGGEVRSIAHCDRRLQEAVRLGFTKCIVPHKSKVDSFEGTQVIGVKHIEEAIEESLED